MKARCFILMVIALFSIAAVPTDIRSDTTAIAVIPKPQKTIMTDEHFTLTRSTIISVPESSEELLRLGLYLAASIGTTVGYLPLVKATADAVAPENAVSLRLFSGVNRLGEEGYILDVTDNRILIMAAKGAGVFYGIQTLKQIMMSLEAPVGAELIIPGLSIEDSPAFGWRGMLMDCSRHYMTKDFIKRYIDLLAFHKMNVFHWHLTDDQGWRLEIKAYPKLTEVGAWRIDNGVRYGGFYTQDDVREIIDYAHNRYITVIPEIEMPGHATAAIAAYPELGCEGKPIAVESAWGIHKNLFCAGKEETFAFLETVLTEVAELFPSPYIHIGGDEAKKDKWQACPLCQKRIANEGLKDENELQGYLTSRIDAFLETKGKTVIGWDEILEGKPSRSAIVQSWRGMEGAMEGTKEGHTVISSPHTHTYFDYPIADEGVHVWWMPVLPMEMNYAFNPAPDELSPEQKKLILGGECTIWTERAPEPELDNSVFPRLCSFSEALWTARDNKDFIDFTRRMDDHYKRLDTLGVAYYAPSVKIGSWNPGRVAVTPADIEWDITDRIRKTGHYRFTFRQDDGESGVVILEASILENGVKVATDSHRGTSGKRNEDQNYRFDLKTLKPGARYILKAKMNLDGESKSKGSVLMRRFDFK